MAEVKYHRVVIKLSGEALAEDEGTGIDPMRAANIAKPVSYTHLTLPTIYSV
jgi:uridylate kinase